MVYVTAIHQEGGSSHEHITSVQWRDPADGKTGQSSKAEMVDWINSKNGDASVTDAMCVQGHSGLSRRSSALSAWRQR